MQKSLSPRFFLLLTLFTALLVIGCSSDPSTPEGGDGGEEATDLVSVINGAGTWVNDTNLNNSRTDDGNQETTYFPDGTIWSCVTTSVSLENSPSKFLINADFDVIWPGAILQGSSLADDPPTAVRPRRGNGGVTIDIITGETESNSAVFDEVSKTEMVEALNSIIAGRTILPARFNVQVTKVESRESMRLAMGLKVETFTTEFAGRMTFTTDRNYTRYVVSLVQPFYVMEFVAPTRLGDWFHPDVTVAELQEDMGPDNPPVYVSSVTYGRKVYILLETTSHETEFESHLQAHYETLSSVDGSVDLELNERADNLHLEAVVWGGSASAGDYENPSAASVQNILNAEQAIQTGLMLSYRLKDIRTGQTVQVKLGTQYDVEDCTPLGVGLNNKVFGYNADDVGAISDPAGWHMPGTAESGGYFGFDTASQRFQRMDPNFVCLSRSVVLNWPSYLQDAVTLESGAAHTRPQLVTSDSPNQSVGHVVQFLSGFGLKTQLPFPGGDFEETDYTLFMVMSGGRDIYGVDRVYWNFMYGCETVGEEGFNVDNDRTSVLYAPDRSGPNFEGRNLMFGWAGDNLIWDHSGEPGSGYTHQDYAPSQEYKVYCLRYVRNHSGDVTTSIFVNGEQTNELSEGELTVIDQLSGFVLGSDLDTSIRSGSVSVMNLRLIEGFTGAVTNELIEQHSADLAEQEGL